MALYFELRDGAAVDRDSGLNIRMPRMQPDEAAGITEFQYPIYLGEQRIHGVALLGADAMEANGARRLWTTKLELGAAGALEGVFELKRILGNDDGDFQFLQEVARGLVVVFATEPSPDYDFRYSALISADALAAGGVVVPLGTPQGSNGEIVLAEAFVPARADRSEAS